MPPLQRRRPADQQMKRALRILRARGSAGMAHFSTEELVWAVEMVRQCDPNHQLLRYGERTRAAASGVM